MRLPRICSDISALYAVIAECVRFRCALDYSLTRQAPRVAILLLLHALATFLAWLAALNADTTMTRRYGGIMSGRARRHHSLLRSGWERLRQRWEAISGQELRGAFTYPPSCALQELRLPA